MKVYLSFLVTVEPEAPIGTIQLCFEAFIEGVSIAFVPINVSLGGESDEAEAIAVTGRPVSSAFASYSSKDASVVALCLSALKRWDRELDVFMDCLDLTPNEDWKRQLERVIPTKDAFLLFWSVSARDSPWVRWELRKAVSAKGLDWIRPMPLDDPGMAPPPEELKHLHFGDRFLMARQAFLHQAKNGDDEVVAAPAPCLPQLYLMYDQRDTGMISAWEDVLFKEQCEVIHPVLEGDEAELREYHEENLRSCDGVLIFYGAGNEPWVRRQLREVQKSAAYGRNKAGPSVGVCLVAPRTPERERFRTHEALVIPQWDGVSIELLQPFLANLRHICQTRAGDVAKPA